MHIKFSCQLFIFLSHRRWLEIAKVLKIHQNVEWKRGDQLGSTKINLFFCLCQCQNIQNQLNSSHCHSFPRPLATFRILCKNSELPQQISCYVIQRLPLFALSHPNWWTIRRRGKTLLHYATFSCSNIIINWVWKYGWRRLVRWYEVQRVAEWNIDFFFRMVTFSRCVHEFSASSSSSALTIHFEEHKIDR